MRLPTPRNINFTLACSPLSIVAQQKLAYTLRETWDLCICPRTKTRCQFGLCYTLTALRNHPVVRGKVNHKGGSCDIKDINKNKFRFSIVSLIVSSLANLRYHNIQYDSTIKLSGTKETKNKRNSFRNLPCKRLLRSNCSCISCCP